MNNADVIKQLIEPMPIWKDMGITITNQDDKLTFAKNNLSITIGYVEFLVAGARSIVKMFAVMMKE